MSEFCWLSFELIWGGFVGLQTIREMTLDPLDFVFTRQEMVGNVRLGPGDF